MELTILISKIVGPVLLVRALSIVLDRRHFAEMLNGLEKEVTTVSFSMFPVALMMVCLGVLALHTETSSVAAVLIHIIAWGGLLKGTALVLFPRVVVSKARLMGRAGFLNVVLVVCLLVGGYFTWFGYFSAVPA